MARWFRIETVYALYERAQVVGERAGQIGIRYSTVRESRRARDGQVPYAGGTPQWRTDWVNAQDIVRRVALD